LYDALTEHHVDLFHMLSVEKGASGVILLGLRDE
jgi:hypothetical protein